MVPFLRALSDGKQHRSADVAQELAVELRIDADELAQLLPSGRMTVWRSRVHWASQYLSQAEAITRLQRGVFVLAERGRQLLAEHPDGLSTSDLHAFPEFVDFVNRSRRTAVSSVPPTSAVQDTTPQERVEAAALEVNASVAAELLQRINSQPPAFLEKVVLDLLLAMGYAGSSGRADHLGGTGDEGVDGVLRQDALGLDLITSKRRGTPRVGSSADPTSKPS